MNQALLACSLSESVLVLLCYIWATGSLLKEMLLGPPVTTISNLSSELLIAIFRYMHYFIVLISIYKKLANIDNIMRYLLL